MVENLQHELARICQAVEIESPAWFRFAGARFETAQLQQVLYERCYAQRFDGDGAAGQQPAVAPDPYFIQRLVEANQGRERLDPGWQVTGVDPYGRVAAVKNGASRLFQPGEYSLPYGTTLTVWLAKGSLTLQPGFYFAYGETLGQEDPRSLVRLYWNVRADSAPRLLAALTRSLNASRVPFQFKTLIQPEQYAQRTDGSVLYFDRRFFPAVARVCTDLVPTLAGGLEAGVPLFTKPLAPGLGLAEDPGTGDSFGLSRCRIFAAALLAAHVKGAHTPEARLAEVEAHFSAHGLTLDRPYLNPQSVDFYELPGKEKERDAEHDRLQAPAWQ